LCTLQCAPNLRILYPTDGDDEYTGEDASRPCTLQQTDDGISIDIVGGGVLFALSHNMARVTISLNSGVVHRNRRGDSSSGGGDGRGVGDDDDDVCLMPLRRLLDRRGYQSNYAGACSASFRFVSFRFVSFRFVSFRFVSFRFVSFRFVSFRFVSLFVAFFLYSQ
jgi:hypothetical protein